MRRIKNPNQRPPRGSNYEEPATGFRFRGSSLQDLAAKRKLHREVNIHLGRASEWKAAGGSAVFFSVFLVVFLGGCVGACESDFCDDGAGEFILLRGEGVADFTLLLGAGEVDS